MKLSTDPNNFKVYKHTNKFNGKVYIGITCQTLEDRWRKGNGYKDNDHFYKAIKKYGWDNFSHEILFERLTEEEAGEKEKQLIAFYNSTNQDLGYNISLGGTKSRIGLPCSEETKEKISKANTGRRWSLEARQKMSESRKGLFAGEKHPLYGKKGKDAPAYGYHHTDECKQKMSELKQGLYNGKKNPMYGKNHTKESIKKNKENQPHKKEIICLETQKVYSSMAEASRELNICRSSLGPHCDGKKNFSNVGGYHFKYLKDYNKFLEDKDEII